MPENCIFCKIVAGEIPANVVWQDEDALAFQDIAPKAPVHILVIPRVHVANVIEAAEDGAAGTAILRGVAAVARQENLADFNTILNTGLGAGQTVFHAHAHILAGRNIWLDGIQQ